LVDVRPLCTFAQHNVFSAAESINVGDQCWSEVENNSVPASESVENPLLCQYLILASFTARKSAGLQRNQPFTVPTQTRTEAIRALGPKVVWMSGKMRLLRKLSAFKRNGPIVSRRDLRRVRVARMNVGFLNW
jgi:hypothetical protein